MTERPLGVRSDAVLWEAQVPWVHQASLDRSRHSVTPNHTLTSQPRTFLSSNGKETGRLQSGSWWERIHITQVQLFWPALRLRKHDGQDASPRGRHELPRFQEALGRPGLSLKTEGSLTRLLHCPKPTGDMSSKKAHSAFSDGLTSGWFTEGQELCSGRTQGGSPVPTSQWPASLGGTSKPSFSSSRSRYFSYCRYPAYPPPVATRMGRGRSRDEVRAGAVWTFLASVKKQENVEPGEGTALSHANTAPTGRLGQALRKADGTPEIWRAGAALSHCGDAAASRVYLVGDSRVFPMKQRCTSTATTATQFKMKTSNVKRSRKYPRVPCWLPTGPDRDRLSDLTFMTQTQFWLDSSILSKAKSHKLLQFNNKRQIAQLKNILRAFFMAQW